MQKTALSPTATPGRTYSFVAKETTALPSGLISVAWAAKQPAIAFSAKQPSITFTAGE